MPDQAMSEMSINQYVTAIGSIFWRVPFCHQLRHLGSFDGVEQRRVPI